MKLEKFIEHKFPGLNYLSISDERYLPTVIINDEDRIIDSLSRVFDSEPANKWTTREVSTRINGETIQGTRKLEFGAKFLGVVSIKAGVTANYSVTYEFDDVTSVVFNNASGGVYENEVRALIMKLKDSDRATWKDILHEYVVMESVYVKNFKIKLTRDGVVLTQANIQTTQGEISIDGSYTWSASGEMIIQDNKTPLGLRGFQVKRFM